MKILVCPHDSSLGGSQLNAIELADTVRNKERDTTSWPVPGFQAEQFFSFGVSRIPAEGKKLVVLGVGK